MSILLTHFVLGYRHFKISSSAEETGQVGISRSPPGDLQKKQAKWERWPVSSAIAGFRIKPQSALEIGISKAETYLSINARTRGSSKEKFKGHDEGDESSSDESEDDEDASTDSFDDILEDIKIHVQGLIDLSPSIESPAKDSDMEQIKQKEPLATSGFSQVMSQGKSLTGVRKPADAAETSASAGPGLPKSSVPVGFPKDIDSSPSSTTSKDIKHVQKSQLQPMNPSDDRQDPQAEEEDEFIDNLRQQNVSWKKIRERFRKEFGKDATEPRLQMRLLRRNKESRARNHYPTPNTLTGTSGGELGSPPLLVPVSLPSSGPSGAAVSDVSYSGSEGLWISAPFPSVYPQPGIIPSSGSDAQVSVSNTYRHVALNKSNEPEQSEARPQSRKQPVAPLNTEDVDTLATSSHQPIPIEVAPMALERMRRSPPTEDD